MGSGGGGGGGGGVNPSTVVFHCKICDASDYEKSSVNHHQLQH